MAVICNEVAILMTGLTAVGVKCRLEGLNGVNCLAYNDVFFGIITV